MCEADSDDRGFQKTCAAGSFLMISFHNSFGINVGTTRTMSKMSVVLNISDLF